MTLKETLKVHKKAPVKKKDNGFWEVRIDVEVVEQMYSIEYVKASSELEAQEIARKQFDRRTPKLVHDRTSRDWYDKNRYSLQHLRITKTGKRKKFSISEKQREILGGLIEGKYLKYSYDRWSLVNPAIKNSWSGYESVPVPSISVDSLFQKGLLIDLTTASMSEKEVEIQAALGSLPELKAYTIDMVAVNTLGLRL